MSNPGFSELENVLIPIAADLNLAARIWLPNSTEDQPVPAILEYLPYRKRDGTALRDHTSYPVFAKAGYAGVRVDISGHGESDGDFDDEYSPRELSDGLKVIQWIADQPWCDGNVGMMGISWGGFNSLQLAALQPPALKAVIAIGTTVDRYNDDIHYKHGCILGSNFTWSSTMLCFASRPPDPIIAGDSWQSTWLHRLQTQPFPLENWLSHQRRDDYWKHGSVCEDYQAIKIPSLVISGWCDGYINAPPAMTEHSGGISKAINGPWIHKYPHFALPKPQMDFHQEAILWWDQWLKGIQSGRENLPDYRAYLSENVNPNLSRESEPGRWIAEQQWPSTNVEKSHLFLHSNGTLGEDIDTPNELSICSPQDCGVAAGEFFPLSIGPDLPGDQETDDHGSLVFESVPFSEPLDILGRPELTLLVSVDQPLANLIVRINDIHPDGSNHRVSWGALNLCHRQSNEHPEPMTPGHQESITIKLNHCAYRFLPKHRLRIALSTAYWPMIMPPPNVVTATISTGSDSFSPVTPVQGDQPN